MAIGICKWGEDMKIPDVVPNLKNFIESVSHQLPENLEKIIVFGSYARGEATIRSDVDIALVFGGEEPTQRADKVAVDMALYDFDDILHIDLYCTNQTRIDTEQNVMRPNYWIREEGKLLWTKEHTNTLATGI